MTHELTCSVCAVRLGASGRGSYFQRGQTYFCVDDAPADWSRIGSGVWRTGEK